MTENINKSILINGIVAMNPDGIIGKNGKLPWRIPEDLEFFKGKTQNTIVVMGRKTFDSLKQPLSDRIHLVISRTYEEYKMNEKRPNIFWCNKENLSGVLNGLYRFFKKQVFVVGGSEIFKMFSNIIKKFYLTIVHKEFTSEKQESCVFFFKKDLDGYVISKNSELFTSVKGYNYEFLILQR